jgi:hypothetical protein
MPGILAKSAACQMARTPRDSSTMAIPRHPVCAALLAAAAVATPALGAEPICRAVATSSPTVVELYTSEGCSSCPPADRWASTLKGRDDLLVLAFHVDYWDRLGWPDRFASKEATARQYQLAQAAGRRGVYTPQVVVNGQDWQRWPTLPAASRQPAALPLVLERQRDRVVAQLAADAQGAARPLAGYWAVLEDSHLTRVRAGENAGETLRHDHVVRLLQPVPPWPAERVQRWELRADAGTAAHPRRVAFVVADALTMKPLQALALALPPGC